MSCNERNPLLRDGTSLLTRVLKALATVYARPDERDDADLILFAKRYAAYLNYFNSSNVPDGNWEPLMKMDASVPLAVLSKIDARAIADYKKILYKRIRIEPLKAKQHFTFLFDCLFSLKKIIDEQVALIDDNMEYKTVLKNIMSSKLALAISNLKNKYDAFVADGLIEPVVVMTDSDAPLYIYPAATIDKTGWDVPAADVLFDPPAAAPVYDKIVYIINHNLFNAQVEAILEGTAAIARHAEKLFRQTLESFPAHAPHYALFLAFLNVFRIARDHLNTYTQRHLDFYYKEVLQLKNKDPEPDAAHLAFELQKPIEQHLLKQNILFSGGKDITGKEISYVLEEDVVLNKAVVRKIHSLQIVRDANSPGKLKAAPIANSDDGLGAKITSADNSWFTFGDARKEKNAEIGFAIVSNILFLNEGDRTVTVSILLTDDIPGLSATGKQVPLNCFTAKLTGKKEWHEVKVVSSNYDPLTKLLSLGFRLAPGDPSIIAYSEKIHKDEPMDVSMPVVKFILDQESTTASYVLLKDKRITAVSVSVAVTGVRDLVLSSDAGSIDASKPFKPFGDFPANGAGYYIGSKEVFQKNLSSLDLQFNWNGTKPLLNMNAFYLRESSWKDAFAMTSGDQLFFSPATQAFQQAVIDFGKNESLKPTTLEGFLKVQLASDSFSLQTHLDGIAESLSKTTITWDSSGVYSIHADPVQAPEEIIVNDFYIDYTARETISFEAGVPNKFCRFFHVTPFGYYEVPFASSPGTELIQSNTLLPDIRHNGELFIGFENATPDLVINALFQVADGSSNPLRNMETLQWYYLVNNEWKEFKKQFIVDKTNNFTQSGIVTVTLPQDINDQHTYLQNGLLWIKIAAPDHTDAVCKMILIKAQAAKVTLMQDEASEIEFRQVLPSTSISKLLVSDASVKTIEQPFDSFGGRTRETDEHFYTRVSERLRHKQRAITIWDYEHILLEKFPALFKVKCINHAGFYTGDDNKDVFCENYPGHVTIIPIPDLKNKTNINPLRPYTPIGLITNMENYLNTIVSPFVKLRVRNPRFEEIQLDFKVKYYDGIDSSFYTQLLNREIEKFLCPWAFDQGVEISFGGKIIKSVLLNFVEERRYVDFVTCFKMHHIIREDGTVKINADVEEATASTARSILVSYFNEDETDESKQKHLINPVISCDC